MKPALDKTPFDEPPFDKLRVNGASFRLGPSKPDPLVSYSRIRLFRVLLVLTLLLVLSFFLALAFGEETLSWQRVWQRDSTDQLILFSLRLPHAVLAAWVGASLAASGCALQAMMRNPLADPFVLGVSGGAALGATVAAVLGIGAAISAFALMGALTATALVMFLGSLSGRSAYATLLAGVVFNAFALSIITFLRVLWAPEKTGELLFWLAGNVGYESGATLVWAGVFQALALLGLWALSGRLNLMMLGDDDAASLGVPVEKTRWLLWLAVSASVALSVSLVGLLGFVGLLVPHILRLWLGADQRLLIPASALGGASFLLLADVLTRLLFPVFQTQVPVGVLTSMGGGAFFLVLLLRSRKSSL